MLVELWGLTVTLMSFEKTSKKEKIREIRVNNMGPFFRYVKESRSSEGGYILIHIKYLLVKVRKSTNQNHVFES